MDLSFEDATPIVHVTVKRHPQNLCGAGALRIGCTLTRSREGGAGDCSA